MNMAVARRVPASGPLDASIMIIGEAPGADEESHNPPTPFVGKSGHLLDGLLKVVGVNRDTCYVSNIIKYRPPGNKLESKTHAWWIEPAGKMRHWAVKPKQPKKAMQYKCNNFADGVWYNDIVAEGLSEIRQEIAACHPKVIVALGNVPLWALTGNLGIANWRGSELVYHEDSTIPVIPTYHPAYVLRVWSWKATVLHDLRMRVMGKLAHPEDRQPPAYNFSIPATSDAGGRLLASILSWVDAHPETWVTVDVETRFGRIACVGIATTALDAVCVPLMHVDGRRWWPEAEEQELARLIRAVLEHPNVRVCGQNFNYDRQYFYRDPAFGFVPRLDFDTMIAQHLLLPGTPKDLAYLSSMYCRYHRYWKEEGKEIDDTADEDRWWHYNCLDAVVTYEVMQRQRLTLAKVGLL